MLTKELKSEFTKYRGTLVYWLMVLCPFAIAFLLFLGMSLGSPKPLTDAIAKGENPWHRYIVTHYRVLAVFFFPLYVAMLNGMIYAREHRHNTWKHIYTLPIPTWKIEISKNLFSLLITFLTLIIYSLFIPLSGYILSLVKPSMPMMKYNPLFAFNLFTAVKLFFASIGIWAVHNWLARRFTNFGINIGVSLIGVVSAGILLQGWKYVMYYLYAVPAVSMLDKEGEHTMFTQTVVLSLIVGLVVWAISFWDIQRKKVKA